MPNSEQAPIFDASHLQHFDAALESSPENLEAAKLIDSLQNNRSQRYDTKQAVNEGGMKKIMYAEDKVTNRPIAKAIMKDTSNKSALINFINAARITALLEHPNIVPVHDLGVTADGEPYFTMKLLGGENLQDIISKLAKNESEYHKIYDKNKLLDIFLKICDAVSFAHSKGVIHLDLKPANIQVNQYGEVLVCDWGLARFLKDEVAQPYDTTEIDLIELQKLSVELTQDGLFKGSPGYMAPEQITANVGNRSTKTDIYSLGCILYSLLTYRNPLKGSVDRIIKDTLKGEIIPPKERNPLCEVSDSLNAVTIKAISPKIEDRYDSVGALASEIRSFTHGFATKAEAAGFSKLILLLFKRHKNICLLIGLFFLVTSIIISLFMINLQKEKSVAQNAQFKAEKAQIKEMQARAQAEHALELAEIAEQKRHQLRLASALSIYDYAKNEFNQKKYHKTKRLLERALELNPDNDEIRFTYAQFLFSNHNFHQSISELNKLKLAEGQTQQLSQLNQLCIDASKKQRLINSSNILKILTTVRNTPDFHRNYNHFVFIFTKIYQVKDRFKLAKDYLQQQFKGGHFNFQLKELSKNKYHLSIINGTGIYDITLLNELPITELYLANSDITDLSPLLNMPLKQLDISYTHVSDLAPLKAAPLEELNLYGTNIRSILPLKQAQLKKLTLSGKWTDLTPLHDSKTIELIEVPKNTFTEDDFHEKAQRLPLISIPQP